MELKSFYSDHLQRHFPGTAEVDELIETGKVNDFCCNAVCNSLTQLWLIIDCRYRSDNDRIAAYRRLYADALKQLGAKTPRGATLSARPARG